MPETLQNGPPEAPWTLLLAHGAGVPMQAPFMAALAEGISADGAIRVVRFNFPYMAEAQRSGGKRPPNGQKVLEASFEQQYAAQLQQGVARQRLLIGGKSLGGRVASLIADRLGAAGLVILGYPFHPPGKPQNLRTEHLATLQTPTLICQGERDPFGNREEVEGYELAAKIRLHWLPDGDHGFKPRKASGRTEALNLQQAAAAVRAFVA